MSDTPRTDAARATVAANWKDGGYQGFSEEEWLDKLDEVERGLAAANRELDEVKALTAELAQGKFANPDGYTILDFLKLWCDQYKDGQKKAERELAEAKRMIDWNAALVECYGEQLAEAQSTIGALREVIDELRKIRSESQANKDEKRIADLEKELAAAKITIGTQRLTLDRWEGRPPQRDCNCQSPACSTRPHFYSPKSCTHYQPVGAASYADMQEQLVAAQSALEQQKRETAHERTVQEEFAALAIARSEQLAAAQKDVFRRIESSIDDFVQDYVMECDEGTYTPTEHERFLLTDFAHGLVANAEIDAAMAKEKAP